MKYQDLSEGAKRNARDWYRRAIDRSDLREELDSELAFIHQCAVALGIRYEEGRESFSTNDHDCYLAVDGLYAYQKGWKARLEYIVGGDDRKELLLIGKRLQEAQKPVFYRAYATIHSGLKGSYTKVFGDSSVRVFGVHLVRNEIETSLLGFLEWGVGLLRRQEEYLYSDENVEEAILANEYDFDADGNRLLYR